LFLVFQHVCFIQHYDQFADKKFCDNDALSSLCLDAFGNVNDQKHYVDNLCAANDCFEKRAMAWAVDESKLQVFFFGFVLFWHFSKKGREAEIEGDASFLGLRVFIEGCSGSDFTKNSAERRFSGIDMTQDSNVDIKTIGWLNFGLLLFGDVKVVFLHDGSFIQI
jgi:hypothetical protein